MPLFEFACSQCRHEFETLVRSSSSGKVQCPQCGSNKVSKKFSVFASHIAGGGSAVPSSCTPAKGSCCPCGKKH